MSWEGIQAADTARYRHEPPPAEVIQAFLTRADRVISSDLVDAARLKLSEGFSFTVHLMKDGGTQVSWLQENEYLMKGLAADLRPFLPWVDDASAQCSGLRWADSNCRRPVRRAITSRCRGSSRIGEASRGAGVGYRQTAVVETRRLRVASTHLRRTAVVSDE